MAAIIFWIFNALNHDYTADLKYPIRIVYDHNKLSPVSKLPVNVEINATGYGWNILRKSLSFNQRPIFIKPTDLPKKNFITSYEIFPLFADQLKDVKINYFLKDTIHLDFDFIAHKKVKLFIYKDSIPLANGSRIVSPILIQPDHLTFAGSSSQLKGFPDSLAIKVNEEGIQGGFEEIIPVEDSLQKKFKVSHAEVLVKFETETFETVQWTTPVTKINYPKNVKSSPDSVEVIVYLKNKSDKVDNCKVVADYKNRKANKIPLRLEKPDIVKDYQLSYSYVKLKDKK